MSRFLLLICLFPLVAFSQKQANPIYWQNASFEGEPQDATVPIGWLACEPFTTPDILPGFWGIFQEASEGETYVGLITRENGTLCAVINVDCAWIDTQLRKLTIPPALVAEVFETLPKSEDFEWG